MPRIPFLGRLNPVEYFALVCSFVLVGLEAIIRLLTLALPDSIINLFYRASRRLWNRFAPPAVKKSTDRKQSISTAIRDAADFVDICRLYGYYAEEHIVQTGDGYLLGLHRLGWRRGEEGQKVNSGPNSIKKPVVYLHHGLLMNSEVWVCVTEEERSLPFTLVERGYDVWLGNNRGNKYSKKSVLHSPKSIAFWNFSMDEFAFHDIPDSIHYILDTTGQPSLSYIGFSQGTAQAFAALAVHPKLNDKVNVFVALAPAMSPAGLSNGIVDALIKTSPHILFLLFGQRSILSSATMWQSILYPPIFIKVIDLGLDFLFGWKAKNISAPQKLAAYPHLYSFTSTKSVVHWFQIIRNKSFQMYDDDVQPPLSLGSVSKYTKVAKFPTKNIKTPVVLVYGGSDSLVDIDVMLKELPQHTVATEIPSYEHLDFLWAREVATWVFPHVFDALESFSDAGHTKEEYARYKRARSASMHATRALTQRPYNSDDDGTDSGSYAEITRRLPAPLNDIVEVPRALPEVLRSDSRDDSPLPSSRPSSQPSSPNDNMQAKKFGADGTVDSPESVRSSESSFSAATGKLAGVKNGSLRLSSSGGGRRGFSIGMGKAQAVISRGVEGLGDAIAAAPAPVMGRPSSGGEDKVTPERNGVGKKKYVLN